MCILFWISSNRTLGYVSGSTCKTLQSACVCRKVRLSSAPHKPGHASTRRLNIIQHCFIEPWGTVAVPKWCTPQKPSMIKHYQTLSNGGCGHSGCILAMFIGLHHCCLQVDKSQKHTHTRNSGWRSHSVDVMSVTEQKKRCYFAKCYSVQSPRCQVI